MRLSNLSRKGARNPVWSKYSNAQQVSNLHLPKGHPYASCPKTQTNSRPAIPKTCKQVLLHTSAATLPGAPSTRPGSAGCSPCRAMRGRLRVLHHYSRHPGHQRRNRPAQRASGQAPSLSPAVIRPRALRDRRGGHGLYGAGRPETNQVRCPRMNK